MLQRAGEEVVDEVLVSRAKAGAQARSLIPADSSRIGQVIAAALDQLVYPEPSEEWQREVSLLEDQVNERKRKESEMLDVADLRETQIARELKHLEESNRTTSNSLRQQAQEQKLQAYRTHSLQSSKDTNALLQLSNEKCNTLSRLFEMRVQAMEKKLQAQQNDGEAQRRIRQLEARVRQLEDDNHSLRMGYEREDHERGLREQELKKLAIEQQREIQDLHKMKGVRGGDKDFSHLGLELADTMSVLRGDSLRSESQSGVKVKRAVGAAQDAGICNGDVILWVTTSQRVTDVPDFANAVGKVRMGDNVSLLVRRGGVQKTIDLEVGRKSSPTRRHGDGILVDRR